MYIGLNNMSDSIGSRFRLQPRSFYLEALKQHKRTVALIFAVTVTAPLFLFTSLPPVEVIEEVPTEVEEEVQISVEVTRTEEIEVNKTVEVEVNITEEVVVNRTIGVNITEGGSIFLEPQPAPPLIDSDIVFCIDTSGSMDINRMPLAKTAIRKSLELINQSYWLNLSNDRVALVSFDQNTGDWTTDATVHAELGSVGNKTHLNYIISQVDGLTGSGGTDAWAGLNASLDLILNAPRNTSVLKTILFLTDGKHNSGPWGSEVNVGDYTGFMELPSDELPYSESPIVMARTNDVKIYSIGLFEGTAFTFDENFLTNISLNITHGTFGDFFAGNDTLSLTEGFLQSRDAASGWARVLANETTILNNGTQNIFEFNVTSEVRRLKWDVNWNDSTIDINLTIIDPNGTQVSIYENTSDGIIPVSLEVPKSIIIDFPIDGLWLFNISWNSISSSETLKSRLSSFEPPIFINSIFQINASEYNQSEGLYLIYNSNQETLCSDSSIFVNNIHVKISDSSTNDSYSNQSVIFLVNVTNKNPIFTYHNITPFLLGNFTEYNITTEWTPPMLSELSTGNSTIFMFNLTFNEPSFLQGTIYFKVNCTEGYYDAIAQNILLDYRIITQNVTVETYLENQTLTVLENQTISTIIITQSLTKRMEYAYNRQVFDTLKWTGFFASLGLLASFLAVYVAAQAYRLRQFAKKLAEFRSRLFPDQTALDIALQEQGITMAPEELSAVIDSTVTLDQFGENIYAMTGKKLTPEDLIRLTSGVSTDQIINRLSFITGLSPDEIAAMLERATSVEDLIKNLNLDIERFLDIITKDEQVLNFQARIATLIQPRKVISSNIIINEDPDFNKFRSRLRGIK